MSDFTIHNLRDVEDSAPASGYGEIQEARFAQGDGELLFDFWPAN